MAAVNVESRAQRILDEFAPASDAPVDEIVPFMACPCCLSSCYFNFPGCIGCSGTQEIMCCHSKFLACKIPPLEDPVWCQWSKGHTYCAHPESLYKQRSQLFCIDLRCSVPLSEDIPPMLTCCFFTMYARGAMGPHLFYKSVKDLTEAQAQRATATAAAAQASAAQASVAQASAAHDSAGSTTRTADSPPGPPIGRVDGVVNLQGMAGTTTTSHHTTSEVEPDANPPASLTTVSLASPSPDRHATTTAAAAAVPSSTTPAPTAVARQERKEGVSTPDDAAATEHCKVITTHSSDAEEAYYP